MANEQDYEVFIDYDMFRYKNGFYFLKQHKQQHGDRRREPGLAYYSKDYLCFDVDILEIIKSSTKKNGFNKITISFISDSFCHSYKKAGKIVHETKRGRSSKWGLTREQILYGFEKSTKGAKDSYYNFLSRLKDFEYKKNDVLNEVTGFLSENYERRVAINIFREFIDNNKRRYNGEVLDKDFCKIRVKHFEEVLNAAFKVNYELTFLMVRFMFNDDNQYTWINFPDGFLKGKNTFDYRQHKQISISFEDLIFKGKQKALLNNQYTLVKTNTTDEFTFDFMLNNKNGDFKATTKDLCDKTVEDFFITNNKNNHEYIYLLILYMREQELVLYKRENGVITKEYSIYVGFDNLNENLSNIFDHNCN